MSAMEKKAVRGKLFGESKIYNSNPFRQAFAELRAPILGEEIKDGKEKVRVTDRSGKSYVVTRTTKMFGMRIVNSDDVFETILTNKMNKIEI